MIGENNLGMLLSSLNPRLMYGEYVFCTINNVNFFDYIEAKPIA